MKELKNETRGPQLRELELFEDDKAEGTPYRPLQLPERTAEAEVSLFLHVLSDRQRDRAQAAPGRCSLRIGSNSFADSSQALGQPARGGTQPLARVAPVPSGPLPAATAPSAARSNRRAPGAERCGRLRGYRSDWRRRGGAERRGPGTAPGQAGSGRAAGGPKHSRSSREAAGRAPGEQDPRYVPVHPVCVSAGCAGSPARPCHGVWAKAATGPPGKGGGSWVLCSRCRPGGAAREVTGSSSGLGQPSRRCMLQCETLGLFCGGPWQGLGRAGVSITDGDYTKLTRQWGRK